MPAVFADTSGWGNVVEASQPFHALAANLYRDARERGDRSVVTTNYILAELVALLTSPLRFSRPEVIAFLGELKASPYVEVVHIDPVLDERAFELLRNRPDKTWSLVDCASFVVMQQRGILEALTTDHQFEQAGFIRLLR